MLCAAMFSGLFAVLMGVAGQQSNREMERARQVSAMAARCISRPRRYSVVCKAPFLHGGEAVEEEAEGRA